LIQIITHTRNIPGETVIWQQLLEEGADSILVRKPGWQEADYELLLAQVDPSCYPRLMIAEHAALCERFGLQGLHFGEAARGNITEEDISIHSAETLQVVSNNWNNLLLSPVFDSISKKGYSAAFDENFRLDKDGFTGNVLALGGINDTTAGKARNMQFDGIALLGAIWENPEGAITAFCRIRDIWRKIN
jgi:thiamine-phosphate pyrophosphorylase